MDYPEIYAVDFDGTLNTARTYPELGAPNVDLFEFLKERRAAGDKIILWTCREGELLKAAVKYCENYGLFFDAVNDNMPENIKYFENNCRKIWAYHYIDDRNTTGTVALRSRLLREMMELLNKKIKDSEESIEKHPVGSDQIGRAMAHACYAMASEIKEKFESIFYKNAEDITNNGRNIEKRAELERLTKVINAYGKTVVIYTRGKYEDTTAGEMEYKDIRNVMKHLFDYEETDLTPEQIRELKERDKPRKIEINAGIPTCPVCGHRVVRRYDFCPDCGQRLEHKEG